MVRIGILGTSRIARLLFQRPLQGAQIAAIASREQSRAAAYAREYNIPRFYGAYDDLLGDASLDVVYIPLPQSLHAEYTVKAARSGKHVLVEKPAALTAKEVSTMIRACERHGVLLMEGLMYRFLPIQQRVKQLVVDGTIGALRYIDFNWCVNARATGRTGFRFERKMGGGALYDLGVYGIDFMKFLSPGGRPRIFFASTYRKDRRSVDEFTHALLTVDGIVAAITVSYATDANYYTLSGDKGSIHVPRGVAGRVVDTLLQVHLLDGDKRYEEHFPAVNSYILELEHFARCIEKGEEPMVTPRVTLENIRLVEQVFKKAILLPRSA
jgi:xylose dehydrogenase (NAD/NADP)